MNNWKEFIKAEKQKDYFKKLVELLMHGGTLHKIYPPSKDVFNAFNKCPLDKVKVVILGQDPYHGANQAHGLAFSVLPGNDIPPSLKNIFKEIQSDVGINSENLSHGCLISWAEQGVLLLNTVLTVPEGMPGLHKNLGWETFTDNALKIVNGLDRPIVYMLWGSFAKSKKVLLNNPKHLVLEAGHPSPLSCRLFFGCKHFSKANEFLISNNITPIDWSIR